MTKSSLSRVVDIHKALANPVRVRILAMLRAGPLCVCQITAVARLAASTISQHLSDLKRAGLVAERKEGRWVMYRLADDELTRTVTEPVLARLREDPMIEADQIVLRELRGIAVEDLCRVDLDLPRLGKKSLTSAAARAEKLRATS